MKGVVGGLATDVTKELLAMACIRNHAVTKKLLMWKHLYCALEKLTEGEAHKIIITVAQENGLEARRQLNMQFELQMQAQKNTALLELQTCPAAATTDETKH